MKSFDNKEDSILTAISEKTRTQLDQYKNSRKLPLLGMKWLLVKDKILPKKEKAGFNPNLTFQDADSDESETKAPEHSVSCFPRVKSRKSQKLGADHTFLLINDEEEGGSRDGSLDHSYERRISKKYQVSQTSETTPDVSPIFKATFRRNSFNYKTVSAPLNSSGNSKKPSSRVKVRVIEDQTIDHRAGNFATEPMIETKARSKSVAVRPVDIRIFKEGESPEGGGGGILRNHNSANPRKFPIIKISKVQSEAELDEDLLHLPNNKNLSQPTGRTSFYLGDPVSRKESAMMSANTSQANLEYDPFRINTEQSVAFGGKAFQNTEILESKLPMTVIEHPNIPKVKALQANRVLAGRPLQLPLSHTIEDVLKDIDKKSRKFKAASPLDDYAEDLLRGSFVDYFKELNPLGRLDTEQLTFLNGLNDIVRTKRGLTVGSKNGFQEFIDRSPESKAHRKAQLLLNKLKEAQTTDGKPDEVIKEYRKDMPLDLSRQFLASSFGKKPGNSVGPAAKARKYNFWHISSSSSSSKNKLPSGRINTQSAGLKKVL